MELKLYQQGESPESDKELFGTLGSSIISEEVHEQLGIAVSGRNGDCWAVATEENTLKGFAQYRVMKNGNTHIRYVYGLDKKIKLALIRFCLKEIGKKGDVYTNDRGKESAWKTLGFTFSPKPRGEFGLWKKIKK